MEGNWLLKLDEEVLGVLVFRGADFPRIRCDFLPEPPFAKIAPLFSELIEAQRRAAEALNEEDSEYWNSVWDELNEEIHALGIVLEAAEAPQHQISKMSLFIDPSTSTAILTLY